MIQHTIHIEEQNSMIRKIETKKKKVGFFLYAVTVVRFAFTLSQSV